MSKKTNEIKKMIEEKEEKYNRKLTRKEKRRIEKKVLRKYIVRKEIVGILLALGVTTASGGIMIGDKLLADGINKNTENKKQTESTIEKMTETETNVKETTTNSFTEDIKAVTYNQIIEEIVKKYKETYDIDLDPSKISYIKSSPHFVARNEDGYIQDYKETDNDVEFITHGIDNIYSFINKEDNKIICSFGKILNKVENVDTKYVKLVSNSKEYVSSNEKINITEGKDLKELENMYKAMEEKYQQKTQESTTKEQIER